MLFMHVVRVKLCARYCVPSTAKHNGPVDHNALITDDLWLLLPPKVPFPVLLPGNALYVTAASCTFGDIHVGDTLINAAAHFTASHSLPGYDDAQSLVLS